MLDRRGAVDALDDDVGLVERVSIDPLRICRRSISPSKWGYQLPQWCTFGASASNARLMSKSGVRSSNATSIASTAAIAVSSSSAATTAIGWPL